MSLTPVKVLYLHPPNFQAINRAFDVRGKPVIYAYGDRVYNPLRIKIPPQLVAHEAVHQKRQGADPAGWWDRYIVDHKFRLDEEIPAHAAEYEDVLWRMGESRGTERALDDIATRLASPLYGSLIDYAAARNEIACRVSYAPLAI